MKKEDPFLRYHCNVKPFLINERSDNNNNNNNNNNINSTTAKKITNTNKQQQIQAISTDSENRNEFAKLTGFWTIQVLINLSKAV